MVLLRFRWNEYGHSLTHLAFEAPNEPNPLIHNILGATPRIQVLLIVFDVSYGPQASSFVEGIDFLDPRLVVALYDDYCRDWERGARDGKDIWMRAEEFVARKRQGEITGASDLFVAYPLATSKGRRLLFHGRSARGRRWDRGRSRERGG
ncbi:hypothetical protein B0H17DRAFT_317742 [Mycena rosella]|uniref:Uncharacterized protein n=1 Tax=Mycena rosella TaxID=1033263 RepID=A0AAD7DU83_MYCRO|nr:hypothetical protein B0H17DRAFT_317742 [Mycena rosella]